MGEFSLLRRRYRSGVPVKVVASEVTDAQKATLFDALEKQFEFDIKKACEAASISRVSFERATKVDPDFAARIQAFRGNLLKQIEEQCMRLALQGDGAMARFVLQAEMPEKYGSKRSTSVSNIESPDDLKNLTDEELEELLKG